MMLERRLWSNFPYISLILLICLSLCLISINRPSLELTQYPINEVYTLYNSTGYVYPLNQLPLNDYHQLIDLNFTFNILNLVCENNETTLLIVLVHSSPENFLKRKTIRETWGSYDNLKIIFALGAVDNLDLQKRINRENQINKDLIQGTFLDTYRNITYKHVMVFKYVIYYCRQAKYILKTDDDVFVNIKLFINFLNNNLSAMGATKLLLCTPRKNSMVLRSYRSKWRVSFNEYPYKIYPTYCPGWALLYSPDVIFNLYKEAQKTNYFWIDDIHITGTLAKKLHLIHTNIESLVISRKNLKYITEYGYNITKPFLYGRPDLNEKQIRLLWEYVKKRPIPKTLFKYFHS